MSWLFFAILAYFVAAVVSALDKVILTRAIPSPRLYAMWVGLFGAYGLVLIPFGFRLDPLLQNPLLILMSLASGAIFVLGLYFLYSAIQRSEVSRIAPLFGVLVTMSTLLVSVALMIDTLDLFQLFAFTLLLAGGALISIRVLDLKSLTREALVSAVAGAFLFAVSFVLIKSVYLQTGFLNGFVIGRVGEVLAGLGLLFFSRKEEIPSLRMYVRSVSSSAIGLFILTKSLAGAFFLLQNYAVFLGSVVLVQALSGIQYVFLIFITLFLSFRYPAILTEKSSRKSFFVRLAAIFLIGIGLVVLAFREKPQDLAPGLREFGVTFSVSRAQEFGLDWQSTFTEMLDDLKVRKLRLSAYWDMIQPMPSQVSFFELDWQIAEAERRNVEVVLVVGQRLPRWPECHIPDWGWDLSKEERERALLLLIEQVIIRYRDNPSIKYWQVENEPFLPGFGVCPEFDKDFLDQEIALVRSLDTRPVIVTDSGELSAWVPAARRADIFGTTMYRIIWSERLPGSGYLNYYLPPSFFYMKANIVKYFARTTDIIVSELQAEPWGPRAAYEMPVAERDKSLSFEQLQDNIRFAREVGFREAYLWGAEWWLWERVNGRPEFWNYARTLFGS